MTDTDEKWDGKHMALCDFYRGDECNCGLPAMEARLAAFEKLREAARMAVYHIHEGKHLEADVFMALCDALRELEESE